MLRRDFLIKGKFIRGAVLLFFELKCKKRLKNIFLIDSMAKKQVSRDFLLAFMLSELVREFSIIMSVKNSIS